MSQGEKRKIGQPWIGVTAIVIVILGIAILLLAIPYPVHDLLSAIGLGGLVWFIVMSLAGYGWPAVPKLSARSRVLAGACETLLFLAIAAVTVAFMWYVWPGWKIPLLHLNWAVPVFLTILYLTIIWDSWPLKGRVPTWALILYDAAIAFVVGTLIWKVFVNYSEFPFLATWDPGGLFPSSDFNLFLLWSAVFMFLFFSVFERWPFTKLKKVLEYTCFQAAVIILGLISYYVIVNFIMPATETTLMFWMGGPGSALIIWFLLWPAAFHHWPVTKLKQPGKGAIVAVISIVASAVWLATLEPMLKLYVPSEVAANPLFWGFSLYTMLVLGLIILFDWLSWFGMCPLPPLPPPPPRKQAKDNPSRKHPKASRNCKP